MKKLMTILYEPKKMVITYCTKLPVILTMVLFLFSTGIPGFLTVCCAQGPWTQKEAKFPTGRWELSTCVVDGKIYAIGGATYDTPRHTVEVYDPATDTWTKKSDMPTARQGLSASVVNGKIYAIGGDDISNYSDIKTFSTVEEYDPETDTWTTKSPMPTARGTHSANVLDGKIYVIGGSSAAPYAGIAILRMEVYDPATDTWTHKGNIPRRVGSGFSSVVDGKIYVFGGYGGLNKVHEYDPVTDAWSTKSDMPTGRCALSTSVLNGKIYAIGGHSGVSPDQALKTVEIYDPATDKWKTTFNMLTDKCGVRTSVVNGKIYAIGGYKGTWISAMCTVVGEYDPHFDLLRLVEKANVDISYAQAGIDSVCIKVNMSDPTDITLMAKIETLDQTPVDSIQLYDDGMHNDEKAGDGLYANVCPVNSVEEQQYYVDFQITRIDMDTVINFLNNKVKFTTIGPVTLESYSFVSSDDTVFNPGDCIIINLKLKNNGSTVAAPNIEAKLTSLEDLVSVNTWKRTFGDIAAGESSTSDYYGVTIDDEWSGISQVSILVEIYSNDYMYWKDTLYITVQGSTSMEDIREQINMIYPNPTNDILNIEINNNDKQVLEIEILDMTGKLIYQKEYRSINEYFVEQIDLSSYAKGIYLVKVRQNNSVYTGKVVVR